MTRTSQILWPVVALVASFVAVFAFTWLISDPRPQEEEQSGQLPTVQPSPAPSETQLERGMVIEVRGVQLPAAGQATDWRVGGIDLLDVRQQQHVGPSQICLTRAFEDADWRPDGGDGSWTRSADGWCRSIEANQSVNVKFVKQQ